jgi:hypothetical protein
MSLTHPCNYCSLQMMKARYPRAVITIEPADWPGFPNAKRVLRDGVHCRTFDGLPDRCISLDGGECMGWFAFPDPLTEEL